MNSDESIYVPKITKLNNTYNAINNNNGGDSSDGGMPNSNSKRTLNKRVRRRELSLINQENRVNIIALTLILVNVRKTPSVEKSL